MLLSQRDFFLSVLVTFLYLSLYELRGTAHRQQKVVVSIFYDTFINMLHVSLENFTQPTIFFDSTALLLHETLVMGARGEAHRTRVVKAGSLGRGRMASL